MELNKNHYKFEVIYSKKGSIRRKHLLTCHTWDYAVDKADEYRALLMDFGVLQSMGEIKVMIWGSLIGLSHLQFIESIEWREELKDVLTRCANDDVAEWVKEAHDQK